MSVRGLPGIPGGSALVPALDFFTARAFERARQGLEPGALGLVPEMAGIFLWDPASVVVRRHAEGPDDIEWQGQIRFIQCLNVADDPIESFELDSQEIELHVGQALNRMAAISDSIGAASGVSPHTLMLRGFSPFVGIGHSHPGGTLQPSAADFLMSVNATAWRRATAPQTLMGFEEDAQFFEADFLIALEDIRGGDGTLVHFKRGRTEGTWRGNFAPAID